MNLNLSRPNTTSDPWSVMSRLQRDLDRLMQPTTSLFSTGNEIAVADWVPAVDIREEQNQFVLTTDLPGIKASDIEVTMEKGVLTLRGKRHLESREEKEGYRVVERTAGSFYRSFQLPDTLDAKAVKAKFHDGVLTVHIPRQAQVMPRRITVEAA